MLISFVSSILLVTLPPALAVRQALFITCSGNTDEQNALGRGDASWTLTGVANGGHGNLDNNHMRLIWESCTSHIGLKRHREFDGPNNVNGGCKHGAQAFGWLADPGSCHGLAGDCVPGQVCNFVNCDWAMKPENNLNWDLSNINQYFPTAGPTSRSVTCTYVNV